MFSPRPRPEPTKKALKPQPRIMRYELNDFEWTTIRLLVDRNDAPVGWKRRLISKTDANPA
jgi:hypothetical protein